MEDLEQLVQLTLAGDGAAWQQLQAALDPMITSIARSHPGLRAKGLAALPDDVAEVRTATFERLARKNFDNLKRFVERQSQAAPERPERFDAWIYGAVDYVIREHLRQRFGRAPKPNPGEPNAVRPSKRELQSQAGRIDGLEVDRSFISTLGMTSKLTVAEIWTHIERDFDADEVRALRLYYSDDRDFDEIASGLGLADDKSAEKLIRRLNARLRYRFANERASGEREG
jgi:hypothetical protein